jgi:NAD(P)-dependent dehydrogenase (short-subunit alcohol dehydrogenase family)
MRKRLTGWGCARARDTVARLMPRYPVAGKVAFVTGGMRGIGFETAKLLHARGASVALTDIDPDGVRRAAAEIATDRVLGLVSDVSVERAVKASVEQTVGHFGQLDVVVANAGIAPRPRTFLSMDPEEFDRVVSVNLQGVVHTVRAALPQIVARRGHVVLISSIYAFTNGVAASPYAASKAAVEQLGRALRVELEPHGASATIAYFGFVETKMVADAWAEPLVQKLDESIPRPLRKRIPPARAAKGIVNGIERRAARVILPRRWELLRLMRGVVGPASDEFIRRHRAVQPILRESDARAIEAKSPEPLRAER